MSEVEENTPGQEESSYLQTLKTEQNEPFCASSQMRVCIALLVLDLDSILSGKVCRYGTLGHLHSSECTILMHEIVANSKVRVTLDYVWRGACSNVPSRTSNL